MNNLRSYEKRVKSQFGEDGLIAELISRLNIKGRATEVGSHWEFGNCYYLADQGWDVTFIDVHQPSIEVLKTQYPNSDFKVCKVTAENINEIVPNDTVLLSIDIDGNDYHVWKALTIKPAIIIIEFNHVFKPPIKKIISYDPEFCWDGTNYFGASLSALEELGTSKGYNLVTTDSHQGNAYFVLKEFGIEGEDAINLWFNPRWSHPESPKWNEINCN